MYLPIKRQKNNFYNRKETETGLTVFHRIKQTRTFLYAPRIKHDAIKITPVNLRHLTEGSNRKAASYRVALEVAYYLALIAIENSLIFG